MVTMTDLSLTELFSGFLAGDGGTALVVVAIAVVILTALMLAASAGYFRIILNIAAFARPDARVRAIGNPLVDSVISAGVCEAHSLTDLFDRFRAAGHTISIGVDPDRDTAERAIRGYYYGRVMSLAENVPDSVGHFFLAYRDMLAAGEAIWLVLGKIQDLSPETLENDAIPVGPLTAERIRKVAHAAGPEDALGRIADTPFGPVLTSAYRTAAGDPARFAAGVQVALLEDLALAARSVDISLSPPVTEVSGRMIDCANILALARGVALGAGTDAGARHLIREGGFELTGERFDHARRAGSLSDLVQALDGTLYEPALARVPEAIRDTNIPVLEAALDQTMLDSVRAVSNQHHLESGPLLRYLVSLGYEFRNMLAVAGGVAARLPPGDIEALLVVEVSEE